MQKSLEVNPIDTEMMQTPFAVLDFTNRHEATKKAITEEVCSKSKVSVLSDKKKKISKIKTSMNVTSA